MLIFIIKNNNIYISIQIKISIFFFCQNFNKTNKKSIFINRKKHKHKVSNKKHKQSYSANDIVHGRTRNALRPHQSRPFVLVSVVDGAVWRCVAPSLAFLTYEKRNCAPRPRSTLQRPQGEPFSRPPSILSILHRVSGYSHTHT